MTGMTTRVEYKATINARVFRSKGNSFVNPETGSTEVCPGGEWYQGREGRWYDHGVISERAVQPGIFTWTRLRFMIQIQKALAALSSFLKSKRGNR